MSGILSLLLGRCLCDRYRVDSVLGTGGMGAVCRAFDVRLERHVAIKVVTAVAPDAEEAELLKARFLREATAAARLRHPNVVTVHDFGTDPGLGIDFLVMEMLAGEDLAARMRRAGGPLPVEETVEILREGGMGLAAGHRAGLVHRDVKPGNIYLVAEPGGWEVKVLDFGIAQLRDATAGTPARLTRFAAPHTPRYASPEQLALGNAALTPATDVFSWALTGVEMLGGEYPDGLNATTDPKAAARCLKRLLARRPEIPLPLAAVLRRSLRLEPEGRYPDADAFLDALDGWDRPPSTGAAAAGYASIVPGPPAAEPRPFAPAAVADDERTVIAPPFAIPTPAPAPYVPPYAAPAPAPQPAAPASAPAAGAESTDSPPAPKRRFRLRPAGWLLIFALLSGLAAWAALSLPPIQPEGRETYAPGTGPVTVPPAGGRELAREEFDRARKIDVPVGRTVYAVIIASFTPDQIDEARELQKRLADRGIPAGLANDAVYPELRRGYIALIGGPYTDVGDATALLGVARTTIADDAFLKHLTLRRP